MDIVSSELGDPDQLVQDFFARHNEALIIYTDLTAEGESTIAAFQKLDAHGPLATVLITLLENLKRARESKHRPRQAATPAAGDESQSTTIHQSGGEASDG